MKFSPRIIALLIMIALIVLVIFLVENGKTNVARSNGNAVAEIPLISDEGFEFSENLDNKANKFDRAIEISTPNGFINTANVTVEENIGKKVILIDFWTYSCINCQRTLPYLNAWHEKYEDDGLLIIGVHTPEFEFEKEYANVQEAVEKFGIKYPVVLDNDFSTWRDYKNNYWPRKYIIDIDGYIVYDHIGEGGYDETEEKIQELLAERSERLGADMEISGDLVSPEGTELARSKSPEIYFGALRNTDLANGTPSVEGVQILQTPSSIKKNVLYLDGSWIFEEELARNQNVDAGITFTYEASKVHFVAGAEDEVTVEVLRDGEPLTEETAGDDVYFQDEKSYVKIRREGLYRLIEESEGIGEHTIEMIITNPGLQAFTFTFG